MIFDYFSNETSQEEQNEEYEYKIRVINQSGKRLHDPIIYIDGEKVDRFPVSLERGEYELQVEADDYDTYRKVFTITDDRVDDVELSRSVPEGIIPNPSKEDIEEKLNEKLADQLTSGHGVRVSMVSDTAVKIYSPNTEYAEIRVFESDNDMIAHGYIYGVRVVNSSTDATTNPYNLKVNTVRGESTDIIEVNYEDLDGFVGMFHSPVEAVGELSSRLYPNKPY